MGNARYEEEAERLAKLPVRSASRPYSTFPLDFTIKAIGRGKQFWNEVRDTLDACGYEDVILLERPSSGKRFFAITFSLHVENGAALDRVYQKLQDMPSLVYLL
jgi:putative lipoic acid-binding regulatory protein